MYMKSTHVDVVEPVLQECLEGGLDFLEWVLLWDTRTILVCQSYILQSKFNQTKKKSHSRRYRKGNLGTRNVTEAHPRLLEFHCKSSPMYPLVESNI